MSRMRPESPVDRCSKCGGLWQGHQTFFCEMKQKEQQERAEEVQQAELRGYDRGFIDALTCFAWWKDGVQYCGTTQEYSLATAIEMRRSLTYYMPSAAKETPDEHRNESEKSE